MSECLSKNDGCIKKTYTNFSTSKTVVLHDHTKKIKEKALKKSECIKKSYTKLLTNETVVLHDNTKIKGCT